MNKNQENSVVKFLYQVMNGTINDKVFNKEIGEYVDVPVSVATRMKAAELLFKSMDNNQKDNKEEILPVIICEDI